jgi:hypothetical protein
MITPVDKVDDVAFEDECLEFFEHGMDVGGVCDRFVEPVTILIQPASSTPVQSSCATFQLSESTPACSLAKLAAMRSRVILPKKLHRRTSLPISASGMDES